MYTFFNYLWSFVVVCTSSWSSIQACAPVWEYMPAYYNDYVQLRTYGAYYTEKQALEK